VGIVLGDRRQGHEPSRPVTVVVGQFLPGQGDIALAHRLPNLLQPRMIEVELVLEQVAVTERGINLRRSVRHRPRNHLAHQYDRNNLHPPHRASSAEEKTMRPSYTTAAGRGASWGAWCDEEVRWLAA